MSGLGRYYKPTSLNDGFVVRGNIIQVPKVPFLSYLKDPTIALTTSGTGRDAKTRVGVPGLVVLHTTTGKGPQGVRDGLGPPGDFAERNASYWHTSEEYAGAHLVVDQDGSCLCCADLALQSAMGSGANNDRAIQIECVSQKVTLSNGDIVHLLYAKQIANLVTIVRAVCTEFAIPLRVQSPYHGHAIPTLADPRGKDKCVIGHRDCSNGRGKNDPGEAIIAALLSGADGGVRFEAIDFAAS